MLLRPFTRLAAHRTIRARAFSSTVPAMAFSLPRNPILESISKQDPASTAVIHSESGRSFSYGELLKDVAAGREKLHATAQQKRLTGERVAFLIEHGYDYVVTFLSIIANNAIAVPLSASFPTPELQYIIDNSQPSLFLTSEKHFDKAKEVLQDGLEQKLIFAKMDKLWEGSKSVETVDLDAALDDAGGMMLYTSGTTSRPKGVVLPTSALSAQAASLRHAWNYTPKDHLLHILPLHHIHGCMNALLTPLTAGSTLEFLFPFKPGPVWHRLAAPFLPNSDSSKKPITFFTAVPTIYTRLQPTFSDLSPEVQDAARKAISPEHMRVAISGSAALPTPTKQAWKGLSNGTVLLERYGMTEIGMALSCGLDFADRIDGSVGWPLPGVEVRLMDTDTNEVVTSEEGQGEIQVRGETVFREYWRNPEATASEFIEGDDGRGKWFKTGDVAEREWISSAGKNEKQADWAKGPMYFIHGRKSADIIKTGGEKVSALEVEREMLSLPEVDEVAVVGLDSEKWGQKVTAVVVLTQAGKTAGKEGKEWSPLQMRQALKDKLVNYKIPQGMKVVPDMPRNAMGKVNKKALVKDLFG